MHFIILFRMNCKQVIGNEGCQGIQFKRQIGPFKIQKILRLDVEQYQIKGQWNIKQNARYAAYIRCNSYSLVGKPNNKLWKQFKRMASFIETRNFLQCKSHHQKLCIEFCDCQAILTHFFIVYPHFSEFLSQAQTELEEKASLLGIKKQIHKEKKQQKPLIPLPVKNYKVPLQLLGTGKSYQQEEQKWMKAMEAEQNSAKIMFNFPTFRNPFSSETSLGYGKPLFNKQIQNEWIECHRLFLAWLGKVNSLMASES